MKAQILFICEVCSEGREDIPGNVLGMVEAHVRSHVLNGDPFTMTFNDVTGKAILKESETLYA